MLYQLFLILRGLPWTVAITVLSLGVGVCLGFPVMMARNAKFAPVRVLAIAFISLVRAVPPIVWIFIIFFGLGTGPVSVNPFVATLVGLGLIAATNMAEIYRGGLISIHQGQWEAAQALNLGRRHTFRDVIMPQMIRVRPPTRSAFSRIRRSPRPSASPNSPTRAPG